MILSSIYFSKKNRIDHVIWPILFFFRRLPLKLRTNNILVVIISKIGNRQFKGALALAGL